MTYKRITIEEIKKITLDLYSYCQMENWAGWDPYDALNSRLLKLLPFLDHRIPRLVMIQAMKRSPINLRPLFHVPKTQNAKAIALFLSAAIKLSKLGFVKTDVAVELIDYILRLRSPNTPYYCWGYSFPWQTRTLLVPKRSPNIVCTTFVANALLDAYESGLGSQCLEIAKSAADYIYEQLYWVRGPHIAGFRYPTPESDSRVHNANFLGSAFLCRVHSHTEKAEILESALNVCKYSVSRQREDGSWYYGEHSNQQWIDNFHTGYNLCGLSDIVKYAGIQEFEQSIRKGFDFYINNFLTPEGAPKYFHDRIYPVDIHSASQSIITLFRFKDLNDSAASKAYSVILWSLRHLFNEHGYFYYQKTPYYTNKIIYIRWSQAWMLFALSCTLESIYKS